MRVMDRLWARARRLCGVDALNLWMWRCRGRELAAIADQLDGAGMRDLARDVRAARSE